MTSMDLKIQLLSKFAKIPEKGSMYSAGYDLVSIEEFELKPMERHLFKIGIKMSIPAGIYGRIAPRSGLAFKNGIDVMAGVIDSDYRGEIGVLLINLSSDIKKIITGDKIAQIIFESYNNVNITVSDTLDKTERETNGFGSTDKKEVITDPIKVQSEFKHPEIHPIHTEEHKSSYGIIIDQYTKSGGIPVKKKYSDEIKSRDNQ